MRSSEPVRGPKKHDTTHRHYIKLAGVPLNDTAVGHLSPDSAAVPAETCGVSVGAARYEAPASGPMPLLVQTTATDLVESSGQQVRTNPSIMRRTIYIDTTELHDRHLLANGDWEELLDRAERGQLVLAVPEVVLQEANRQYCEKLDRALAEHSDLERRLRALGLDPTEADLDEQRDRLASAYRPTVDSKILDSGGRILPLPGATQQEVLDRVVARRKPFNENGKGY